MTARREILADGVECWLGDAISRPDLFIQAPALSAATQTSFFDKGGAR